MIYALLGYDDQGAIDELAVDDQRAFHAAHRLLHGHLRTERPSAAHVLSHYRFRPPRLVTTIRKAGDTVARNEGPATVTSGALRALYLVEAADPGAVLDLAGQLPAINAGGTIEVWPLTEPQPASEHSFRR